MTKQAAILSAFLLGAGCSHAAPKPAPVAEAVASVPRPEPPRSQKRQAPQDDGSDQKQAAHGPSDAVYFDFDSALLRPEARTELQKIGKTLMHSSSSVRIEGNCDERGTAEYNIALGDRRAREAEKYLERLGIQPKRLSVVSYGSERPVDTGHDESAWAKNRRDDFVIQ